MIFFVTAGFYGYSFYGFLKKHQSIKFKVRYSISDFSTPYLNFNRASLSNKEKESDDLINNIYFRLPFLAIFQD
jgi:hypothetical protein